MKKLTKSTKRAWNKFKQRKEKLRKFYTKNYEFLKTEVNEWSPASKVD